MTTTRNSRGVKGHRLETISCRGGIIAGCSCGATYAKPDREVKFQGRIVRQHSAGVWSTWERPAIREAHQVHLNSAKEA